MALSAQSLPARSPSASEPVILVPDVDFDAFYRREFAAMVALARAICGDHQQAEDLAQEAMSRAHRHWPKVSGYDRPGAWLRRVTINLALSRRRRFQRELTMLKRTAATLGPPHEEPLPGSDDEVWQAVRTLPPKQRAAIALFYQEDLSTADIADALGCTVSTATSHLSQARAKLAVLLGEDESPESREEQR
jgi:RNA polymerase sigma-70 factor (ECF subfamily)